MADTLAMAIAVTLAVTIAVAIAFTVAVTVAVTIAVTIAVTTVTGDRGESLRPVLAHGALRHRLHLRGRSARGTLQRRH